MSAVEIFQPPRRDKFTIDGDEIQITPPQTVEEEHKTPIMQIILPLVMMGMMIGMVALMFFTTKQRGGAMSPMMLMMPLMMGMSMFAMLGQNLGGGANNGLNDQRKSYFFELREKRKEVHERGEELFNVQATNFPRPATAAEYIGNTDLRYPVMWQTTPDAPGGIVEYPGSIDEISFSPFLSARMGTGVSNLMPAITFEQLPVVEALEPVTTSMFRNFLRVQAFIPNLPVAFDIFQTVSLALDGDRDKVHGLTRSMILSVAFTHSPNYLRIVVVTDHPQDPKWDWLKWLPHCLHPNLHDASGPARLVFVTMKEFAARCPEAFEPYDEYKPLWFVIVDKPNHVVKLPQQIRTGTRPAVTFMVVGAGEDRLATSKSSRFIVDADGTLHLPGSEATIRADYAEVHECLHFAKTMARYQPPTLVRLGEGDSTEAMAHQEVELDDWFEMLGIRNIETWDPTINWEANASTDNLRALVGYTKVGGVVTNEPEYIDFAESSIGGDGPHGLAGGNTGTGKSFMINGVLLSLVSMYGPDRLVLICMDFKGASTFIDYEKLPHTLAIISNLKNAADMLDRLKDVLEGEAIRRQEIFSKVKAKDIFEYRRIRRAHPELDLEPLPDLLIVGDEYAEFIKHNKDYVAVFDSFARIGRALGIHLFFISQEMNDSMLGEARPQFGFGIALQLANARSSNMIINTDRATMLEAGLGDAITYHARNNVHRDIRTFNIEAPYVPKDIPRDTIEQFDAVEIESTDATDRDVIATYSVVNTFIGDDTDDAGASDIPTPPAQREKEKPTETSEQMKTVLMDRLAQYQHIKIHQMWQPPLRIPMTFDTLAPQDLSAAYPATIALTIGVEDRPREHTRAPFTLDFTSGRYVNGFIAGTASSGRTTMLQTMVASAARSYLPSQVQFMLLAYDGGDMLAVQDYPHVIAAGLRGQEDVLARFLGEILRLVQLRVRKMSELGLMSAEDYLSHKQHHDIPGDPYGHVFLLIDGMGNLRRDYKTVHEETQSLDQKLHTILSYANQVGIHLWATGSDLQADLGWSVSEQVQGVLCLSHAAGTGWSHEQKERQKKLEQQGPGTGLDPVSDNAYRSIVPIRAKIEPVIDSDEEVYPITRYTAEIEQEARDIADQYRQFQDSWPPEVRVVPADVPYKLMWDAKKAAITQPLRTAALPIGISIETAKVIDATTLDPSGHVTFFGGREAGKTNALRVVINDVVLQKSAKEAKFIMFDPDNALYGEAKVLRDQKRLAGYARSFSQFEEAVAPVVELLRSRVPHSDDGLGLDPKIRAQRSWYTGPDIYLIIENLGLLDRHIDPGSKTFELLTMLEELEGLGCFVIAAVNSADAQDVTTSYKKTFGQLLSKKLSPRVVLAGPADHGAVSKVKFTHRRPGKGIVITQAGKQELQIPLATPWDEAST